MLRRRIRGYVLARGLASVAAFLGAVFWISLAVDWFFEPPSAVRAAFLAVAALALGYVLLEMLFRRAFVRLSDRSMAMVLEQYFPQFDESLVTAVELTERSSGQGAGNRRQAADLPTPSSQPPTVYPEMLAQTCRQAAAPIGQVDLRKVFNPGPLRRSVLAATVLAVAVGAFAVRCPEALGVWTRRSLMLADELWPRKTRLEVEGFAGGRAKVARGADLTVIAKADLSMPLVPAVVYVRYRTQGGSRHQEAMSREGTPHPEVPGKAPRKDKDPFQEYSYTFKGVLTPIRLDVVGGDDAVRDLHIDVVDNPTIVEMTLDCRFPDYMDRQPRRFPVAGAMPIPAGTDVTVRATANKDLERVEVDSAGKDTTETLAVLDLTGRSDRRSFAHEIADLREDRTLLFTLFDVDGIKSREPMRLTLIAVADEPPKLAARLSGIGSAITPQARLPAAGLISDDYGLERIWFEYSVGDAKPLREEVPIASFSGNPTEFQLDRALDLRDSLSRQISPGGRLLLSVGAADRCNLADQPNVGTSERWLLDVVTSQQLRTMLESRELVLRQRFEAILAEVAETRDLLARIQFNNPPLGDGNSPPMDAASDRGSDRRKAAEGRSDAGAEPGDNPDSPDSETDISPERRLALRTLRVQRAMQNSQKDAHEILAVAVSFEGIREELINNRIDTEELKARLEEGIATPLRRIGDQMYPELERRLAELLPEETLGDDSAAPARRDRAVAQLDAILAAMRQVLGRMIQLEDFNQAVALLREIIEAQEKLNAQTEEVHKTKLRKLLEE